MTEAAAPRAEGPISQPRRALGNMAAKAGSLVVEKGAQALLLVVGARALGVISFGRYSYAANVSTLLAFGTDLGITLWTTRELAREPLQTPEVLATGFRLRLAAAVPVLLALLAWAATLGPGEARVAMLALGVAALARAFLDHARAVFRANERIDDEGKVNAVTALLATAGGLGALWASGRGLPALALGMMAGAVAGAGYGFALFRRRYGRWTGGRGFDRALARRMLRQALPFWLAGLFSLIYSRGDVVILRFFAGDAEVGAYRAAGQLFELTKNLPLLVLTALFPQLARNFRHSRARLRRVEWVITVGLLLTGLLVGGCLAGASGPLARRVLGAEFARSIPALRILSLALPLLFINFGLSQFLIARDLGVMYLFFTGLMVVINLTANLLLARRLGATGAAWSTLVTEAALTVCCLIALRASRRGDSLPPERSP
jgi:O-antigen/teichoic acid export membrane protein